MQYSSVALWAVVWSRGPAEFAARGLGYTFRLREHDQGRGVGSPNERAAMSDIDFLSQLENQQHIQRCQALYDNATETPSKAADRLNSSQIDASEGRIQYFEKLTIGAGAVIGLLFRSWDQSLIHSVQVGC